ncbi:MAG: hypothetical protein GQ477_01730 [Nanohaloarchaea archaeon]|nr:hypothetical protein [Candidatus Nanohaloarchaea archaeon]
MEVITIKDDSNSDFMIGLIIDKYPALKKDIDDGDVLALHNGALLSPDSAEKINDCDTIEFAPAILGG